MNKTDNKKLCQARHALEQAHIELGEVRDCYHLPKTAALEIDDIMQEMLFALEATAPEPTRKKGKL
jgi:hypothetical protein